MWKSLEKKLPDIKCRRILFSIWVPSKEDLQSSVPHSSHPSSVGKKNSKFVLAVSGWDTFSIVAIVGIMFCSVANNTHLNTTDHNKEIIKHNMKTTISKCSRVED